MSIVTRSDAIAALGERVYTPAEPDDTIRALDISDNWLSPKQREFIYTLRALVEEGKPVNLQVVAKTLRVPRQTMSHWRRDHVFLRVATRILASHRSLDVELMHYAAIRRATSGSPIHYELVLRMLNLYEARPPAGYYDAPQAPAAAMAQQVVFVGLPEPPTPEQCRAILPPPGSSTILPAPAELQQAPVGAKAP